MCDAAVVQDAPHTGAGASSCVRAELMHFSKTALFRLHKNGKRKQWEGQRERIGTREGVLIDGD